MKKADLERKRELLAELTGSRGEHDHVTHLQLILAAYASGSDHRREIVDNVVAKYRKVLRANGPNYDGPLAADMELAMKAAEDYGKQQQRQPTSSSSKITLPFSPDEVQRCLFCHQEYRPAVEGHECEKIIPLTVDSA